MNINIFEHITQFLQHFFLGIRQLQAAGPFIQQHKLWKGLTQHGWLIRIFVIVGIILGFKMFAILIKFVTNIPLGDPIALTQNLFSTFQEIGLEGYNLFYIGGFKYVIVLALEVLIIHFGGKTTEILTGKPFHLTFKQFVEEQKRAFEMIIRKYILELLATIFLSIVLGILGFELFKTPLIFLVQCYFLGVVLLDNYFKQRNKTVKESEQIIRQYAGLATAIGLFFYLMLLIPIIGAVIGACVAGVAGTLAWHELKPELEETVMVKEK